MKRLVWLAMLAALVMGGCGASTDAASTRLAAQYGLHLNGAPKSESETVPASLSSVPWDQIQHASRNAGFDLRPYRGQDVTLKTYRLKETLHGGPTTLVVVEREGAVIGAYVVVTDEAGGTYGLKQVEAQL